MNTSKWKQSYIPLIEERINYQFQNHDLIVEAFTHRSFVNENRGKGYSKVHNERLEFLGDSVLGIIVSGFLYKHALNFHEGMLSALRAQIVEAGACLKYVQHLQVEQFLRVGKGESQNNGRGRGSILADLFEAILGAIYLDGGEQAAYCFFFEHFKNIIVLMIENPQRNWKADFQDYVQRTYQQIPQYVVKKETGPDHMKIFVVNVCINGKSVGSGQGSSKKDAEQRAAKHAINLLEESKNG